MLHPEGIQTYPNSLIYTPESQKIAPLALKPGARAPVLQYAHPELGVQPAKILKTEKKRPDNYPDNQNLFTEQRHRKKYVLNDKNIIDSYNNKNYYPNQHFYGLKQHVEPPFWVKISENLKNQFSTGVERVSQLTKPVIDPLVEATQKISQNLGLSRGHEAQDKIGTVASGSSILFPALGLVASGAALGIGAVAVGRYLDVDMLKRSNDDGQDFEYSRAIQGVDDYKNTPVNIYYPHNPTANYLHNRFNTRVDNQGLLINDEVKLNTDRIDKRQTRPVVDESRYIMHEMQSRSKRSLEDEEIDKSENVENLVRNKRFRRTGPDSMMDIIEIDVPTKDSVNNHNNIVLLLNDDAIEEEGKRRRRSLENDGELEDAFQNLENAEVVELAHIEGDWTNTPCAKKIFCDAMIQRGPDASLLMEKKMEMLLNL